MGQYVRYNTSTGRYENEHGFEVDVPPGTNISKIGTTYVSNAQINSYSDCLYGSTQYTTREPVSLENSLKGLGATIGTTFRVIIEVIAKIIFFIALTMLAFKILA